MTLLSALVEGIARNHNATFKFVDQSKVVYTFAVNMPYKVRYENYTADKISDFRLDYLDMESNGKPIYANYTDEIMFYSSNIDPSKMLSLRKKSNKEDEDYDDDDDDDDQ
jgi:hypothetical protein